MELEPRRALGLAAAGLVILVLAWPSSAWMVGLFVLSAVAGALRDRLCADSAGRGGGESKPLLAAVAEGVHDAAQALAFGVAVVVVAQCMLFVFGSMVEPDTILAAETQLSDLREFIDELTALKTLLGALLLALLVAPLLPRLNLFASFLKARGKLSKPLTVLVGITSFTFFSGTAIATPEAQWVAEIAKRLDAPLARIEQAQKSIAAAAVLNEGLSSLPEDRRTELAEHLREYAKEDDAEARTRQEGALLAKAAPSMERDNPPSGGSSALFDLDQQLLLTRLRSADPNDATGPAPTVRAARALEESCAQNAKDLDESENAAIEVVKASLVALIPEFDPRLAGPLVESIVEAMAGSAAIAFAHSGIRDFASARDWWHRTSVRESSSPAGEPRWDWAKAEVPAVSPEGDQGAATPPSADSDNSTARDKTQEWAVRLARRLAHRDSGSDGAGDPPLFRNTPGSDAFGHPGDWRPPTEPWHPAPEFRPPPVHEAPHFTPHPFGRP